MISTSTNVFITSLIFCLDTEQGHIFGYNKVFGEIVRSLGWQHSAVTRAEARVKERPEGWSFVLGSTRHLFKSGPFLAAEKFVLLVFSLRRYLTQQLTHAADTRILFLEWFGPIHLVALILSLVVLRQRQQVQLWMMYRLPITNGADWRLTLIHKALIALTAKPIVLFTDSELVHPTIAKAFGEKVWILPIPHTHLLTSEQIAAGRQFKATHNAVTVMWWPGVPAAEKGLSEIQQLCQELVALDDPPCKVALSEAATVVWGKNMIPLAGGLPYADYWGNSSDWQ